MHSWRRSVLTPEHHAARSTGAVTDTIQRSSCPLGDVPATTRLQAAGRLVESVCGGCGSTAGAAGSLGKLAGTVREDCHQRGNGNHQNGDQSISWRKATVPEVGAKQHRGRK